MIDAQAHRHPVPAIDRADQQGQMHLLALRELRLQGFIVRVGRVSLGKPGQGFRPAERGPLAIGIER
jgi:hypothetical protein